MDVMFKHYTIKEFQNKFTNGKPYFDKDTVGVIIFRPNWDNYGLCFVEINNNGLCVAHGCGINETLTLCRDFMKLLSDSNPQPITDNDIKVFLEVN